MERGGADGEGNEWPVLGGCDYDVMTFSLYPVLCIVNDAYYLVALT